MIALPMVTTVPDGLTAGCSSASAPGMDGAGVVASATDVDLVTAADSDMDAVTDTAGQDMATAVVGATVTVVALDMAA
jgi:hypothetical protein